MNKLITIKIHLQTLFGNGKLFQVERIIFYEIKITIMIKIKVAHFFPNNKTVRVLGQTPLKFYIQFLDVSIASGTLAYSQANLV